MPEARKTPLYDMHVKYGGKMVDFAGWLLPVEYSGIIQEHKMVREKAGLFDVSHMGEIVVSGPQAGEFLQYMTTNDVARLVRGQICYSLLCYEDGGVVDDILIYKLGPEEFLLVVNAANTARDLAWLEQHARPGVQIRDMSNQYAQLALQGPRAEKILQPLTDKDLAVLKYYWFYPQVVVAGIPCLLSRTGYTGEPGFELYVAPEKAAALWEALLAAGGEDVVPAGLGARDTLRMEVKLPLYGHELGPDITPLQAGLGYFVKLDKGDFIGRAALQAEKAAGPARRLVELVTLEKGIPRAGYPVRCQGREVGRVTSGGYAPTLDKFIALALVESQCDRPGETVEIVVRGRGIKARLERGIFLPPFNRRGK